MRIINKKTGRIQDISPGDWEMMKQLGNRENWKVFDQSSSVVEGREIKITLQDIQKVIEIEESKQTNEPNITEHGKQRTKRAAKSVDKSAQ